MNDLHQIQNQILKKLMFSTGLRYSDLKPDPDMENNHFQFHLDQLLKKGFIIKTGELYELTLDGKQYIKSMDNETGKQVKQPHLSVRICCIRDNGSEKEYLFYTRLKHPYYGCQGFPAGKLEHGELLAEAAKRELFEETGLTGEPQLVAVTHYLDMSTAGDCLTDKMMFLFIVREPVGELVDSIEGKYEWIKRSDVEEKITRPFEKFETVLKELKLIENFSGSITFVEEANEIEEKF